MGYPSGVRIFIDGKDATYYIFGVEKLDPASGFDTWRDLDISPYLRPGPGIHTIEITAENGNGRVESRVEIR
jgi:hypothetical protein